MDKAVVIGAGLAGCEAASRLAAHGIRVTLYEMKPVEYSPAHGYPGFAELVCSNSLKAMRHESAAGLLKEEMRVFGSVCMKAADLCSVPAGGALAVDRKMFSDTVTEMITEDPLIDIVREKVRKIPDGTVIVAAGPLADGELAEEIDGLCGGRLSFYDAAAPIITAESLDLSKTFTQSRYDRGGEADYINCPMNKEEYEAFYDALTHAQRAETHAFDERKDVYEGCMPIEAMAARGADTMRYGPLKPVGLKDPSTGHRPWAVLQLRREDTDGKLLNLVGFQTNLKFSEQKRVFSMIPALKNAEFVRYGVMHRNTFMNSPGILDGAYAFKARKGLYFAGQITGVEGYMESASSGILAGINAARQLTGRPPLILPETTMMGALAAHVSRSVTPDFQPMGAAFGLLPPLNEKIRDKKERYRALADRAQADLKAYLDKAGYFEKEGNIDETGA